MNPLNAKRLLRALQDNVSKYEEQFGEIEERPEWKPEEKTEEVAQEAAPEAAEEPKKKGLFGLFK